MRVGMSVFVCMCLLPSCMSFVLLHLCVSALVLMSVDVAMWISMCVCVCVGTRRIRRVRTYWRYSVYFRQGWNLGRLVRGRTYAAKVVVFCLQRI
jgi:hypothetical protein